MCDGSQYSGSRHEPRVSFIITAAAVGHPTESSLCLRVTGTADWLSEPTSPLIASITRKVSTTFLAFLAARDSHVTKFWPVRWKSGEVFQDGFSEDECGI